MDTFLVSLAVFEHSPGNVGGVTIVRRRGKTLKFSNVSVITEDIYLKFRIVVYYQKKGTHTSWGGNPPFFFTKLCPFST